MKEKIERGLVIIIQILLFAALSAPLVSSTSFIFPYSAPSSFFFQLIITIGTVCFAILLLFNPLYRPKFTPLTISLTVFFIIQILLLFASVEPQRSLLGAPERMAGVWNLFHLYLFYIITTSLAKFRSNLPRQLTLGSLLIAVIVSIKYFTLQANPQVPYAQYSFGNPGFIANYAALHIPLALWVFIKSKIREERLALCAIIVLFSAVVITSQNRATVIALFLGAVLIGGYFLMQKKRGVLLASLFIALCISSYLALFLNREAPFVKNNYLLTKLTNWSFTEGTVHNRLLLWNAGWRGFLERPFFGWGRENFQHVYEKYYDPKFYITSPSEPWIDKAHNIVFDELVAGGLINFIAGLAVFIICIITLIQSGKKELEGKDFRSIFLVFFIMYGIQLLFTLDTLGSYIPLFFVFIIIAASPYYQQPETLSFSLSPKITKIASAMLATAMVIATIPFTVLPGIANYYMGKLMYTIPIDAAAFQKRHTALDSIVSDKNSYKSDLFVVEAFQMQRLAGSYMQDQRITLFEDLLIPRLQKIIEKNPTGYLKLAVYKNVLLSDLARRTGNKRAMEENLDFWENLIKKYPHRQLFLLNAAQSNNIAGNSDRAVTLLRQAIALTARSPKTPELYWVMGGILRKAHKDKEAATAYGRALYFLNYKPEKIDEFISAANYLTSFPEGLPVARDIYLRVIALQPNNVNFHANLAYIYGKLGEKQLAIEEVGKAFMLAPERKTEIEKFIRELK